MKKAALLIALLFGTGAGTARPYYAPKGEMIARSEVIAIVDVQQVAPAQVRGRSWTYEQRADAVVVQVLTGELPRRVALHPQEDFICTRIDFRPGRYLVFLRRDGSLWAGSNWYLSARLIESGSLEWYAGDRDYGDRPSQIRLVRLPLGDVLADVRSIMGAGPISLPRPVQPARPERRG